MKRLVATLILLTFCGVAAAQSASSKAQIEKKRSPVPKAKLERQDKGQFSGLQQGAKQEERKHDTLGKASKKRHDKAPNSTRNIR